jgi:hypothetical protein
MSTKSRRHHFVSKCYLKAFSVLRKQGKHTINVFDRDGAKTFATAIENVALERDFNTVDVDGVEPDVFERGAAEFESEFAPALQRIIESRSLPDNDDTGLLLNFITWLATRNPRLRENVRDFHERVARKIMNVALATPERWASQVKKMKASGYEANSTYEQMKSFIAEKQYNVTMPTARHIVLEAGTFDSVLRTMFDRKWVLLKAPAGSGGFITSDHPVCLTRSEPTSGRIPLGYGLRKTEVLFPICPQMAMVGAFELQDGEVEVDESTVARFNGTVALYAQRHAYSRDHHFKYLIGDGDEPRKASRLASDQQWLRREEDEEDA